MPSKSTKTTVAAKKSDRSFTRLRKQNWDSEPLARTRSISASLAHELSQPLAAILTNAQTALMLLARENPNLEEVREILEDIVDDNKRAGDAVQSLHSLLWDDESIREPINLADAIREVAAMLRSEFAERGILLDMGGVCDCRVPASKPKIQQVIFNLIMNAVEALEARAAGQRQLSIRILLDGSEVQASFCDSGPGIAEDRIPRILVEPVRTTKKNRLGIGLMICRSLIESHSGRIWFANNADQGVTFYFALPLNVDDRKGMRGSP